MHMIKCYKDNDSRSIIGRRPPSQNECECQYLRWNGRRGESLGRDPGHSQIVASPGTTGSPLETGDGASGEAQPAKQPLYAQIRSTEAHLAVSQSQRASQPGDPHERDGTLASQSQHCSTSLCGIPNFPSVSVSPSPPLVVHNPSTTPLTAPHVISYSRPSTPEDGYPAQSRGINFPT